MDRQLKITVRTEIKKGFEQLSKELSELTKALNNFTNNVSGLNKVSNAFTNVSGSVTKTSAATKALNKNISDGVRLVNQYATEQQKAVAKVEKLKAAEKAGSISRQQALKTEIAIIGQLIKKTGDLSVLESRRNARGQFGYGGFSAGAVNAIKTELASQQKAVEDGGNKIITEINNQNNKIKAAMNRLTNGGSGKMGLAMDSRQSMYNNLFGAVPPTQQNSTKGYWSKGVFYASSGGTPGGAGSPYRIRPSYGRGGSGGGGYGGSGGGSGGPNIGPSSSSLAAADKLLHTYTKIGHVLFQLQYATYTIFGFSGIAMITQQADAFIDLRNEIARTSDKIEDLGPGLKDVFSISKDTFSDVKNVGKIYSTINRYSTSLGLDRKGVANITRGVAGAFAASPGSAEAKSAAQYQFLQAFQSGRFGGDELRSILEQAPYVGSIIAKGVGKLRGSDKPINLRDSKNPVTPGEVAKVFNDPAVLKEIMDTLANRARTFSDVVNVSKTRFTEMVANFERSNGYFASLNNQLAHLIAGDGFDKLVKGLGDATLAAVTFATVMTARSLALGAGGVAKKAIDLGSGVATYMSGVNRAANMRNVSSASLIGGDILGWMKSLFSMSSKLKIVGGIFTVIAIAAAALIGRFNDLLKQTKSGITLFDILVYAFRKVSGAIKTLFSVFSAFLDPFFKLIDKFLLDPLVKAVIGNKEIQQIAAERQAEAKKIEEDLPTGQKDQIPGVTGTGNKGRKRDPWKEFITDTSQTLEMTRKMNQFTPVQREFEDAVYEIQKKAADALDLMSFEELRKKFPQKAAEVDKLTEQLRAAKLADKINEFISTLVDDLNKGLQSALSNGMFDYQSKQYGNKNTLLEKFVKESPFFTGNEADRQSIIRSSASTSYASMEEDILSRLTPEGVKQYQSSLNRYNSNDLISSMGTLDKEFGASQRNFDFQKRTLNIFGRRKELEQQIFEIEEKYLQLGPGLEANKQKELDLAQKQYALETSRLSNAMLGAQSAISSYKESLSNVAGDMENLLGNAFKNLESAMSEWIQTGKFEWSGFMRSILADLATLFVRQKLLLPLFNMMTSGSGGGFLSTAVSTVASFFNPMASAASHAVNSIAAGPYHTGGVAGSGSTKRFVSPSVFAGATRYHTGGIAGLKPNEVPAILQRGERILTAAQQKTYGGGGVFSPSIVVNYQSSGGNQAAEQANAKNLAEILESTIQKQIVEYDLKNRRPGSQGYIRQYTGN